MKRILTIGKPTHYKLNSGGTACGLFGAAYAAYDPRDTDCLRCRNTGVWRHSMGEAGSMGKVTKNCLTSTVTTL